MNRKYAPPMPDGDEDPILAGIARLDYLQRRRFLARQLRPPFPRFLYRYTGLRADDPTSVSRAHDVVVKSELWLSSPRDFNDPFDTAAHIEMRGSNEERQEWALRLQAQFGQSAMSEPSERMRALLADPVKLHGTILNAFRTQLDDMGVACFTPHPDNLLMWSHYAASHTGVVYQFDPAKHLGPLTYPVPVEYNAEYPVIDWIRDSHQQGIRHVMLRKHPVWGYEHEFRIVHPGGGRSFLPFAAGGLAAVIVGCKAPSKTVSTMRELLKERAHAGLPKAKLYLAVQHPRDYRVKFELAA